MVEKMNLPSSYMPFQKLTICSNILENGKVPISISGDIPFLIGNGNKPKAWINLLPQGESGKITPLVRDNLSLHPNVEVVETDNSVTVTANGETIIEVEKISDDEAIITNLNLRIIGIEIYGDTNSLKIGTNSMSNNKFVNVDFMIGINTK
jgi:hypothetical protein